MEDLSPQLRIVIWCRFRLELGISLRKALEEYFNSDICCDQKWQLWWRMQVSQSGVSSNSFEGSDVSRLLFQVFERGLKGEPILSILTALEEDLLEANQAELDQYAASLSFKALFPLILMLMPAFFLLLVGPILRDIFQGF